MGYAFRVSGIEPRHDPAWQMAGPDVHRAYWQQVVKLVREIKDRELADGKDRFGEDLAPIAASTRARGRWRSHTGMGSADAPPLDPAYRLSRTRSLFAGRAKVDHAEFFWTRDEVTGLPWGRVLGWHRAGVGRLPVRDVIGLSPASLARVKAKADAWWAAHKAGKLAEERARIFQLVTPTAPAKIAVVGRIDLHNATFGIGGDEARARRAIDAGMATGFRQLGPKAGPPKTAAAKPEPPRRPKVDRAKVAAMKPERPKPPPPRTPKLVREEAAAKAKAKAAAEAKKKAEAEAAARKVAAEAARLAKAEAERGKITLKEVRDLIRAPEEGARENELATRRGAIGREIRDAQSEYAYLAARGGSKESLRQIGERVTRLVAEQDRIKAEQSEIQAVRLADEGRKMGEILDLLRRRQSATTVTGAFHGMTTTETFHSVEFDGVKIHYHPLTGDGTRPDAVVMQIRNLAEAPPIPPELARHTSNIYLTGQKNSKDEYWAKAYNTPGFVSNATGGDGSIVVYRGFPISVGSMAHEMGHNLARATWGGLAPSQVSGYSRAIRSGEPPVSDYAKNSNAEDFAEAIRVYYEDRELLKRTAPLRYAAIEELLRAHP